MSSEDRPALGLFEVVPEPLGAGRVPQLRQRLRLDLANAFAGDAELFADFFERADLTVFETEAEPHHLLLAVVVAESFTQQAAATPADTRSRPGSGAFPCHSRNRADRCNGRGCLDAVG